MDRKQIIRMARESGITINPPSWWGYTEHYHFAGFEQPFERFAALVAAHEREACARLCDQMFHDWCNQEFEDEDEAYKNKPDAEDCKKAIRARGKA